ncbi:MAG: KpsF/GutQ family sugar-phosphate isomerase [Ignavibacteria bacterium]|nr:KpsF/GutQ family sugar-phosphate isomerase [Ignavibacteria bacterium]
MENIEKKLAFAREVLLSESNALSTVAKALNKDFITAVDCIVTANKLIVVGIGKSGIIAQKIAATFASVGTCAIYLHPVDALHGDIGVLESNDVCLLLSKSGNTSEVLQLVPYLKKKGVKIISIVGTLNSPIARLSDVALSASIEKEACPYNLAPTTSASVTMGLGDALALSVMKAKNFTASDFAENHPSGQLGRNLNIRVKDVMHKGIELPRIHLNATFREALIASSAKGLGCVCVVESERLEGIITDGDIRRILQQHDDIRYLTVDEVRTKNPLTIHENAMIGEALSLMEHRESQINVLPVLNDSQLCVGVIRLHDILRGEV